MYSGVDQLSPVSTRISTGSGLKPEPVPYLSFSVLHTVITARGLLGRKGHELHQLGNVLKLIEGKYHLGRFIYLLLGIDSFHAGCVLIPELRIGDNNRNICARGYFLELPAVFKFNG